MAFIYIFDLILRLNTLNELINSNNNKFLHIKLIFLQNSYKYKFCF